MSNEIRAAIAGASDWLREHPDQARYTDSLATARLQAGLRVQVTGANGELTETDMPSAVGGDGAAVSPGWLYRASLAACVLSLATMRASQQGIAGFRCEVDVDSESDDRGLLGVDPDIPAGPLSIRVGFRMTADNADRAQFDEIAEWAIDHCPVAEAIRRPVPLRIEILDV